MVFESHCCKIYVSLRSLDYIFGKWDSKPCAKGFIGPRSERSLSTRLSMYVAWLWSWHIKKSKIEKRAWTRRSASFTPAISFSLSLEAWITIFFFFLSIVLLPSDHLDYSNRRVHTRIPRDMRKPYSRYIHILATVLYNIIGYYKVCNMKKMYLHIVFILSKMRSNMNNLQYGVSLFCSDSEMIVKFISMINAIITIC